MYYAPGLEARVFCILPPALPGAQNKCAPMKSMMSKNTRLDLAGATASLLCAVHCLALPLALSAGALGGLHWLHHPVLEGGLVISAVLIASWSLWPAYRDGRSNAAPGLAAAAGFALLALSRGVGSEAEHYLMAAGGLLIATAHYLNWRQSATCQSSDHQAPDGASSLGTERVELEYYHQA